MTTTFETDLSVQHWPVVRPWLENACEECDGWWTIDALEDLVNEGRALLWLLKQDGIPVAAVVTTIANWEGKRVAEILVAGGEGLIDAAEPHFNKIHEWARSLDVPEIFFRGRRGWARALKSFGYDEIAVTLRKAL